MIRLLGAALLMVVAAPAMAQDEPRFCPNRPSLGSSACTTAPGQVQIELGGPDWQRDRTSDQQEDRVMLADTLVRFGIGDTTELQIDWTGIGRLRTRDRTTGAIDDAHGIGDTVVALRQNLRAPDGKGLSYGVQPFVSLPTGTHGIGDGDWGAGVLLPVTYDLSDVLHVAFTGTAEAAVDEDRHGRHFAASSIVGLSYDVTDSVSATGEVFVERDRDPAGHETHAALAASLAWQPTKTRQLDLLVVRGVNHATPDIRVALGGALLF